MLLKRTIKEDFIKTFFLILAAVSIFIVFFVIYFLFSESLPAFQEYGFSIFGDEWSVPREVYKIGAALFGTAIVTIGAMIIAIPDRKSTRLNSSHYS